MAVAHTQMTLEEFLQLPDEKPALEFEDGMVSQKVSPKGKHSVLQGEFTERINRHTVRQRLAMAFPELRASFSGRSYVPDVAVYLWDRIPLESDGNIANDFVEPPDIAVEIVSPEQSVNALIRKCFWYIEHGVKIAVLVDPYDKSVIVFRPEHSPDILSGDDRIGLDDVICDFQLTVQELFDSLRLG